MVVQVNTYHTHLRCNDLHTHIYYRVYKSNFIVNVSSLFPSLSFLGYPSKYVGSLACLLPVRLTVVVFFIKKKLIKRCQRSLCNLGHLFSVCHKKTTLVTDIQTRYLRSTLCDLSNMKWEGSRKLKNGTMKRKRRTTTPGMTTEPYAKITGATSRWATTRTQRNASMDFGSKTIGATTLKTKDKGSEGPVLNKTIKRRTNSEGTIKRPRTIKVSPCAYDSNITLDLCSCERLVNTTLKNW